jgi:hypothetical protein
MTELIRTDADWFKYNKHELDNENKIDYFIGMMAFPTHKNFSYYQFYDVL